VSPSQPDADASVHPVPVFRSKRFHSVVFGEVGLDGEIRGVQQAISRIKEAEKMGFTRYIIPARNQQQLVEEAMHLPGQVGVAHITEALEQFHA